MTTMKRRITSIPPSSRPCCVLLLLAVAAVMMPPNPRNTAEAWMSQLSLYRTTTSSSSRLKNSCLLSLLAPRSRTTTTTTALYMAPPLPEGYQEFGDYLIRKVARDEFGLQEDDDDDDDDDDDQLLTIEWKPGKVIVTVNGNVYVSNDDADDDDDEDIDDVEIENDDDELALGLELEEEDAVLEEEEGFLEEDEIQDDTLEEELEESTNNNKPSGVDVTRLARAINQALDDDGGIGWQIAETHEIEVTTPGASNELRGDVMFAAYRGFEVTIEFQDPKTKKKKTTEGRLVERNDEFTVINIKGRMKKFKNDMVVSVKLPKAKKEKGVA